VARKTTSANTAKLEPALLAKPREEVRAMLLSRIELGSEIATSRGGGRFDEIKSEYARWNEFNIEFLRRAFTNGEYADQYAYYASVGFMVIGGRSEYDTVNEFYETLNVRIERLRSIAERLDLIDEQPGIEPIKAPSALPRIAATANAATKRVFVVHGQDEEAKAIVARFISGCGLEPIILHEQPNGGRTIIEKFEKEADVGFAVILLTPDDVGGLRRGSDMASEDLKPRARQNVILELGYFAGRLGRERVAALKKGDIEMPSDFAGVVWTPMDTADAWKMSLARELKTAGYEFDLGKALNI